MPHSSQSDIQTPSDQSIIWRYISLSKFVRILQQQALFFASADQLADRFEGRLTTPTLSRFVEYLAEHSPNLRPDQRKLAITFMNQMVAVNSWTLCKHESYLLWSQYAPLGSSGVAIRSTVGRLKKSFHRFNGSVWIGKIKYIDYTKDDIEAMRDAKQWFLHKRRVYSGEQELRALIINTPTGPITMSSKIIGVEVMCDLDLLIHSIRVSPMEPEYMLNSVADLCSRFGLKARVLPSELAAGPPSWGPSLSA